MHITMETLPTPADALFTILQKLGIHYDLYHHAPIFTVEEGAHLKAEIPGTHCRNLFLRDKKKRMFLITAANETQIDLKALEAGNMLDCGRVSFGSPERLWDHLGIRPGSVNPFTLINDQNREVTAVLDDAMMRADIINVHPMDNAMTVGIAPNDLLKFLEYTGHSPLILDF